jgi:pimeloyl-ACP methyl ester carboxylesterase
VAAAAPAAVADTFDLVGFDPRGLGRSDPLDCGLTQQQTDALQPYPQPGGFAADVAIQRQIVKKCFARGGGKLAYVTTANTARDIDRIRIALGERKISYFGTSYGTYLGSVYASLFPSRTDRIVLDSAVGPGMVWRDQFRSWGPAMEIRFPDFAVWAAARAASYGFGATPAAVRATYFRLAAQLDAHPQGEVTGNVFRAVTRGGLVPNDYFEPLAAFWQAVSRGQAGQPAAARRDSAPSDSTGPDGSAVFLGIICNDVAWSKDLSTYRAQLALDSRRYPLAGSMAANVWPCAFWPVSPREPAVPITSNGPSNILILQNLRDPATIYTGGVQLRTTLGHRARLVSVDQGGHTVYLPGRNSCAAGIATDFLATGQLPAADRFCSAQPHTK